jgi:hypothetical protein
MTEEIKESVQEVPVAVQEEAKEESQSEAVQEETLKRNVDINWEQANQVLRMQKQQIDELKSQLEEIKRPPKVEEKDDFADLDPEDYLTVSKARQFAEKLATKKASEEAHKVVKEYIQQQTVEQDEQRMRSKHEDYDYVIQNFSAPLIQNDPALAYQIQKSKNPAETAYKLGKLSDSYGEQGMTKQTSPKAEKIMKNTSRPTSGNAVGSPLKTQADQFAKMSKDDIWSQSQKYARGA